MEVCAFRRHTYVALLKYLETSPLPCCLYNPLSNRYLHWRKYLFCSDLYCVWLTTAQYLYRLSTSALYLFCTSRIISCPYGCIVTAMEQIHWLPTIRDLKRISCLWSLFKKWLSGSNSKDQPSYVQITPIKSILKISIYFL